MVDISPELLKTLKVNISRLRFGKPANASDSQFLSASYLDRCVQEKRLLPQEAATILSSCHQHGTAEGTSHYDLGGFPIDVGCVERNGEALILLDEIKSKYERSNLNKFTLFKGLLFLSLLLLPLFINKKTN